MTMRGTDLSVDAPDRVIRQALDSAIGSIDAMELDAENEEHLVVDGVDVDQVAIRTECMADVLDGDANDLVVDVAELPDGVVGVGIDHDVELDLAFELVELGSVLSLAESILIAGDVFDAEVMLLEDVLTFSSLTEVVVAKVDATRVDGNAVGEACILDDGQQGQDNERRRGHEHIPTSSGAGQRRAHARHPCQRWCHPEAE
jgi:hypothetical protein